MAVAAVMAAAVMAAVTDNSPLGAHASSAHAIKLAVRMAALPEPRLSGQLVMQLTHPLLQEAITP
jgi:hypothetical protein